MRDYHVMRDVLKVAAGLEHEAGYDRFKGIRAGQAEIDSELMRVAHNLNYQTLVSSDPLKPISSRSHRLHLYTRVFLHAMLSPSKRKAARRRLFVFFIFRALKSPCIQQ